jgi:hypothetical protein
MSQEAAPCILEHESLETAIPGTEMVFLRCGERIRSQTRLKHPVNRFLQVTATSASRTAALTIPLHEVLAQHPQRTCRSAGAGTRHLQIRHRSRLEQSARYFRDASRPQRSPCTPGAIGCNARARIHVAIQL